MAVAEIRAAATAKAVAIPRIFPICAIPRRNPIEEYLSYLQSDDFPLLIGKPAFLKAFRIVFTSPYHALLNPDFTHLTRFYRTTPYYEFSSAIMAQPLVGAPGNAGSD
jgi:hypothetical protein